MLHMWNLKTPVYAPIHVVFEHHTSDTYELEEPSLSATSLLRNGKQFEPDIPRAWEDQASDAVNRGEQSRVAEPLVIEQVSLMPSEQQEENGLARQLSTMQTSETEPQLETVTQIQFRQALIEVDDPAAFWEGVVGGQVAAIQEQPLNGAQIFQLFEDAIHDVELSETWLVGYLLGLSDALLRARKMYPHPYTVQLKTLKS